MRLSICDYLCRQLSAAAAKCIIIKKKKKKSVDYISKLLK